MMYVGLRMTTSTDRQPFSKWVTFETISQVGLSNRQPVTRESVHDTIESRAAMHIQYPTTNAEALP